MTAKLRTISVLVFTLVFFVACASETPEPATPTPLPPTATLASPTATPTAIPPTPTAPPTSAPTQAFTLATSIEDIIGTWHSSRKNLYLRFYGNGTLHQSHSLDSLDYQPYAISEIWFEGTQMYLKEKAVSGVPSCGDTPGIYEVRLFPDGKIQIVRIKEKCSPRAGDTALQYDPVR